MASSSKYKNKLNYTIMISNNIWIALGLIIFFFSYTYFFQTTFGEASQFVHTTTFDGNYIFSRLDTLSYQLKELNNKKKNFKNGFPYMQKILKDTYCETLNLLLFQKFWYYFSQNKNIKKFKMHYWNKLKSFILNYWLLTNKNTFFCIKKKYESDGKLIPLNNIVNVFHVFLKPYIIDIW